MTDEKTFEEEVNEAKENEHEEVQDTEDQESGKDGEAEEESQEEDAEELERKRKQEEYRERQRLKREEAQKNQDQKVEKATQNVEKKNDDEIEYLKQVARKQQFEEKVMAAEQELEELEKPFKEAFNDYDDLVEKAIKFSKLRLVNQGMKEAQADAYLRREKVLLADKAAAQGLDPVEAVYNEAKSIISTFDAFAEELGYTKGKPKTNLQAAKEIAKPNAFSGGAGKGAAAAKKEFKEMDDSDMDELDNMTLGSMGLKR